ncbi:MAG: glycosyltransferase family 9 protein [Deltaproteobacteria bacterium]|nr:glycosyltransferase family 9 protein [Deltaproteobacteria bacterium]
MRAARPDLAAARRVLAVKLSSFGDIVHCTPCLRALRAACPDAEIAVAVERRFAPILRHDPHVDTILEASAWPQGAASSALFALGPLLRRGGPRFDLALDFQGRHRSAAWVYASRARWRGGRGVRRPGWQMAVQPDPSQHAVDVCAAVAEAAGVRVADRQPRLFPGAAVEPAVDALLDACAAPRRGYLLANPFGIWRAKRWPVDRWIAALRVLRHRLGLTIVLSGSRDECADAAPLLAGLGADAVSLVGRLSLDQALCVYRRAALMISGDSGPLHAAAALGTPVLALYGITWPERTGPRGERVRVLQASRAESPTGYRDDAAQRHIGAITVEAVVDAAVDLRR